MTGGWGGGRGGGSKMMMMEGDHISEIAQLDVAI